MDFAEQVKAQVDIVRTVKEYVPNLRRAGTRWVGLCPFHTEKTPSFGVTPSLGIYKCFGCNAGGDVIKFVQEIEQLTFWEALKTLAERNGIPLPQRRERADADTELRAGLFEMQESAARIFHENLFGGPGGDSREYLTRRGVTASVAQQFQLGYSEPSWDALAKRFAGRYTAEQMEKSGLFGRREDGGFYDRFRGRLMFPVHNESGKVIAFGGRALRPDDEPKYLNSPETSIYRKKTVLYNLHRAKETVRKSERAILVEGYMDVIGVYAAGVKNVVASCGTALTSEQVRSVKRYSEHIVVNFDPDTAGANATERSLQSLIDEGMHVRVLELEAGLDPDEFIGKYGAEAYRDRLDRSTGYFIWLADRARKKYGSGSAEARMSGYEEMLLPAIRRISDRLERASVAAEVAEYLGLDRNLVFAEFRRIPGQRSQAAVNAEPAAPPLHERVLLRSIVVNREVRASLVPRLQISPAARQYRIWRILETICALYQEDPGFSFETLQARAGDSTALLSSALIADKSDEVFTPEQAAAFAAVLASEDLALQYKEMQRRVHEAEKSGNIKEALELMSEAEKLKKRLSRNTAG
jgi:DNA primase